MSTGKIWVLSVAWTLIFPYVQSILAAGDCVDLSFTRRAPAEAPLDWKPVTFPRIFRHTKYELIEGEGGKHRLKAESDASASALIKEIDLDPKV
jgi:hypothetical protein